VDVPRNAVELDYCRIEGLTGNSEELAKVLGIGNVGGPNLGHPYTLTQVAQLLGYAYWSYANTLLRKASLKLGVDIKASDNIYHIAIKYNKPNSITRKYSPELVELLKTIQAEEAEAASVAVPISGDPPAPAV
jgi:hypothetical protein